MKLFWLLLLIVSIISVSADVCRKRRDCREVASFIKAVDCDAGTCRCLTEAGFQGSATLNDKCRCDSTYLNAEGVCLDPNACLTENAERERSLRLKEKVRRIYENLIFPKSQQILAGQLSVADIFAASTRGRIDPLGEFDSFASLVEYYYGLAANPSNRVTSVDFVELFGDGDRVFVRVNIFFESLDATIPPFNLTQSGRYLFGSDDLVTTTDLIIHNLGASSDPRIADREATIQSVCGLLMISPGTCNPGSTFDPLGGYADFADCVSFMQGIEYGSYDRVATDTFVCRSFHAILTLYDPFMHCPHSGRTGGGKCVFRPYDEYYQKNY